LFAGWIADTKWGRFKTIQVSIAVAMFGHIIIIVSAIPSVIANPNGALGCFSVGLIFFGIGVGGFKPNISPMMAEQLTSKPMHVETLKSGERIIIDPALTTQRMFMCTCCEPGPPQDQEALTRHRFLLVHQHRLHRRPDHHGVR
jgi:proton-dependent oligopeptide transporter, POT family